MLKNYHEGCGTSAASGTARMSVQSILFDNKLFTVTQAQAWLMAHNYKGLEVDKTKNELRFRQQNPKKFDHFSTVTIGQHGIQLIIGYKGKKK